jgi:hypothetical protein
MSNLVEEHEHDIAEDELEFFLFLGWLGFRDGGLAVRRRRCELVERNTRGIRPAPPSSDLAA